jgi:2'-5' RNA ligase
MRTFIGIKLKDCEKELQNIQKEFRHSGYEAGYTLPENLHMTLFFLGELNEEEVSIAKKALDECRFEGFSVHLRKVKTLRDMLIAEGEPNEGLMNFQKELDEKFRNLGFLLENRKFYPHVTLARKIKTEITKNICLGSQVTECILFSSERVNNVLQYIPKYIKNAENL